MPFRTEIHLIRSKISEMPLVHSCGYNVFSRRKLDEDSHRKLVLIGADNIMFDRVTRTERQGFFSRVINSFVGILIGLLLVPGSILLITWNEYRTIHRTQGLIQAEKVVAEVSNPMEIVPELNNRLVHVSGMASTEEVLDDGDFNIGLKVLRLERQVEMFQWVESKESKSRDKLGGGKETITTYEYDRKWHRDRVNSDSFEKPSGHSNPQPRYLSKSLIAEHASLGAFHLNSTLVGQLSSWKDVSIDEAALLSKIGNDERAHFKTAGGYLHFGIPSLDTTAPQVGDLRIKFRVVEPTTVSLLSQQLSRAFAPFKTANGESIESLEEGTKSASEMFDTLRFSNTTLATVLRLVGWLLCCVGFSMMASPLKALSSVIPLLGRMVGAATMLIGFILGSTVSLITIGVAWIAVRPLFSLSLLAVASVGIYFLVRRRTVTEPPMAVLVD
jgi:hypothetical protein